MASIIPLLTEFEKQHISERQALPEKYLGLSDAEMDVRIADARRALGDRLVILGHHYQRDEVIRFADYTGDSFRLARQIANRPEADYIVFCGVHFMAESADVLCAPHQKVILPDLAAGCSMADMAAPEQLETCWEELTQMGIATQGAHITSTYHPCIDCARAIVVAGFACLDTMEPDFADNSRGSHFERSAIILQEGGVTVRYVAALPAPG